uniref:variant leucine-rich repeat-containing protein n=1 Tax=Actinotalea sp. JY-7885 TaxID=2758576 RepID=UPI0035C9B475
MTDAQGFTAAQAADPTTPGQTLADIAAQRPDLRPAVAANPATYPGLLEWLSALGDPAVDAALAARGTAGRPPAA